MQRLIAAVVALTLFLSAGPVALAAEAASAPLEQAPEIKPFSSAHIAMAGTFKMDGVTVDILGEGDLANPDRERLAIKVGPFTAEVVMIGDTVFTRTRFEPRWSRQTSPQAVDIGSVSGSEIIQFGRNVRIVGTETVDGVATQHYTASLDLSPLIEPILPAISDRDARQAIASLNGTVDVWVGASDRMVRQERLILNVKLPSIEPQGDPMDATLDLTTVYSKLNQQVTINEPARNDPSPVTTPRPNIQPVVGPPGSPATSTAPLPGQAAPGGQPSAQPGTPGRPPAQAPAQVPVRR